LWDVQELERREGYPRKRESIGIDYEPAALTALNASPADFKWKPLQLGSETRMHAMMSMDWPGSDKPHPQLDFYKRHLR
jgi:hypothetical protein